MGAGVSSNNNTPPQSANLGDGNSRFLVNGRNANGNPAAGRRQPNAHNNNSRAGAHSSASVQKLNQRKRMLAALGEDEELKALTRNADPQSLQVLGLLQTVDSLSAGDAVGRLKTLQQCYPLLEEVPKDRFDQLAMMVYQKEGETYQKSGSLENAKDTYARAITLAEQRVARGDKDMYMILKRYVMTMVGLARIWYEEERDVKGFRFVDPRRPVMPTEKGRDDGENGLDSLESSISSYGSVFSLNQEILKNMQPRPPRSRSGPLFARVNVRAPHTLKGTQYTREDEFVLHSKATRELVASPCELLLLRCCEVVEIGHNCQSELLIPALIELAQIYEDLEIYSRALLLVRRCLGILCSVFDYDHPWVVQLMQRAERLNLLREEQLKHEMATKIQATWKMHCAMCGLADALGRPVKRHFLIPRQYQRTPDVNFLQDFVDDMPIDATVGADEAEEATPDRGVIEMPYPAEHDDRGFQGPPHPQMEDDGRVGTRAFPGADPYGAGGAAGVVYDPVVSQGEVATFTTMVPNARVIGTTQDTETDTHVQQTEFGDMLTVRTTTITRTITENVLSDDNDEYDEDAEEVVAGGGGVPRIENNNHHHAQRAASARAPDAPRCNVCHLLQPPPRCHECHAAQPQRHCSTCNAAQPQPQPQPPNAPQNSVALCVQCRAKQPRAACEQCGATQMAPICPYCQGDKSMADADGFSQQSSRGAQPSRREVLPSIRSASSAADSQHLYAQRSQPLNNRPAWKAADLNGSSNGNQSHQGYSNGRAPSSSPSTSNKTTPVEINVRGSSNGKGYTHSGNNRPNSGSYRSTTVPVVSTERLDRIRQ